MNSRGSRLLIKQILFIFNKNSFHQRLLLAKEVFHRLPLPYSWKRKIRGPLRKILALSFLNRRKKVLPFDTNYPSLNMTHHPSLCSRQIRMRSELKGRNYRTLVLLACQADSLDGLSETLEDLYSWINNKTDLVILSDRTLILNKGRKHPPFKQMKGLPIGALERYAQDYSHLIVLKNGDRANPFALEQLLFHLGSDETCIGIYSDYAVGGTLHPLPDWDPVLIQFENYILAPVLFRFSALIRTIKNLPGTFPDKLKSFKDWEAIQNRFLKTLFPQSLSHLPESLFNLNLPPNNFCITVSRPKKSFSLSIIIPTNGKKLSVLKNCLHSLLTVTAYSAPIEIILLDNSRGQAQNPYYEYLKSVTDKSVKVRAYDHPFNWSAINNFGASLASGEILLFLNDDTEVTSPKWISTLLNPFDFSWVGVVAPRLVYPEGTIQHAGATLLPYGGGAANIGLGTRSILDSLWDRNPRSVSTVMGACLATRRDLFHDLGGFDERYRIVLSETAYCLAAGKSGYHVVYNPHTSVIHHERMSRKGMDPPEDESLFWKEWRDKILAPDPYYPAIYEKNPNSVKFELSDRKLAITVLESPFLYPDAIQNILILQANELESDLILSDIAGQLKNKFPSAKIYAACGPSIKNALVLRGTVDQLIDFDHYLDQDDGSVSHTEIWDHRAGLPAFDIAIGLGGHSKTQKALQNSGAVFTIIAPSHKKGGSFVPVLTEWGTFSSEKRFGRPHYTKQQSELLEAFPLMPLPRQTFHSWKTHSITIGISTGSCSKDKRWPIGHFEQLTRMLLKLGFNVILLGEDEDIPFNSRIQRNIEKEYAGNISDLSGRIRLPEYQKTVEEKCDLYIGNNSEVTRLIASTGISTIAIFGGIVDPFEWFPAGENVTVIFRDVPCAPCYSKVCSFNRECFDEVHPEDILNLIWKDLKKRLPSSNSFT